MSLFHITWLDTFWTDLVKLCPRIGKVEKVDPCLLWRAMIQGQSPGVGEGEAKGDTSSDEEEATFVPST